MARLKRAQTLVENDHIDDDPVRYIALYKWLTKISKVVLVHEYDKEGKNTTLTLDNDCKVIYSYLRGYGASQGYNNIYPNKSTIAEDCCINERTLSRKINTLSKCGLITIIKTRTEGNKWDNNRYKVHQPKSVSGVKWYDWKGERLRGKIYNFDYSLFKKNKDSI